MNSKIISEFQNLINNLEYSKPPNYSFKIKSFYKVIKQIKELDFEINLINIKTLGFSEKISTRIKEIIETGKLSENNTKITPKLNEFEQLKTITGIGPSKAKELMKKKFTLEKLLNNPSKDMLNELTHHQLIGLKYYEDLKKKIPRHIIDEIKKYLNNYDFTFIICGSYRRGNSESGDIDILIQEDNYTLKSIIDLLTKQKLLTDHLTNNGKTKYMGVCKIPSFSQFMRIDIRLISKNSFPFATLYFTGSKNNNTFMRNKAIELGYKLNEYQLTDKNDKSFKLKSEKDIYDFLKLPYKTPELRNF